MSFRLRLIILFSLLAAITFGAGGSLLIATSFQSMLNEEKSAAIDTYETVRNTLYLVNSLGEKTDYNNMTDTLEQIEQQGVVRWQALYLESDIRSVYQSGADTLFTAELPLPESDQCSYALVHDDNGYSIQLLSIITAGDDQLTLKARFDISPAYNARRTQQRLFYIIYATVIFFGIILAVLMSFALTGPLRKLTVAVKRIAGGDLSVRSDIHSRDEFGQLSKNFDEMADKIQENISLLEEDVERQESFMGAFAHELKTPMTSIIGYADLLRQGGLDKDESDSAANYIYSEGKRLEKLSFKLLDLLLMEKDEPLMRQVSLASMLKYTCNALAPAMEKKSIRLVCKCGRGKVLLEPDLIQSLLYNLVDNASKAMKEEGLIIVKGKIISGGCMIQVIDNGQGMEKAELTRITEAFYRVDKSRSRKQGGAGLGLALCKKIVDLHCGTMSFNSLPGQGTCVTVELYADRRKTDAKA